MTSKLCKNCGHTEFYHAKDGICYHQERHGKVCSCKKFVPQNDVFVLQKEELDKNHSPQRTKSDSLNEGKLLPCLHSEGTQNQDEISVTKKILLKELERVKAQKQPEFDLSKEREKLFNPVFLPLNGYDKKTLEEVSKFVEMQDKIFINKIADKCFVIDGFSADARVVVDIEDVKELAGAVLSGGLRE